MSPDLSHFEFEVVESSKITPRQRETLSRLFHANYRDANPAFVDKSLGVLRHVAFARHESTAVGFALAEARIMDLPRLPAQQVDLAGLCCIDPAFRRRGLFGEPTGRAIASAYRVFDFDPESFVCIGEGRPIGHPRIDFEVEPREWEAFTRVDRSRGDALLAIAWLPDAPPGW